MTHVRNPVLAQTIDIRLSLSDWLTLLGWMSAHLTEASPELICNDIRAIGVQITYKAVSVSVSSESEEEEEE